MVGGCLQIRRVLFGVGGGRGGREASHFLAGPPLSSTRVQLVVSLLLAALHPGVRVLGDVGHVHLVHLPVVQLQARTERPIYHTPESPIYTGGDIYGGVVEGAAHPLQVVVVRLLGLDPLENCLVLVSHSQQVPLPPRLVQTAPRNTCIYIKL